MVIAVDQWRAYKRHLPALLGGAVTIVSLALVGPENMLLPALGVIVLVLLILRERLDGDAVPVLEEMEGSEC